VEGASVRPRERRDNEQSYLFNARLRQISDLSRPLVKLARPINWRFLEEQLGAVHSDGSSQPRSRTRLRGACSAFALR
jgi:hypothetical protein